MVKTKLAFFEMQVEGAWSHATKTNQPCFGLDDAEDGFQEANYSEITRSVGKL